MGKVAKISVGLVVTVIVLAVVAVVLVIQNLDSVVKRLVEDVGSEVTGTRVRLADVSIDLLEAKAGMSGLTIGNPAGFDSDTAFRLDGISLDLNLEETTEKVIVIDSLIIDGAAVTAEFKGTDRINLKEIADKLSEGESSESTTSEPAADAPKVIVKDFQFTNASVRLISDILEKDTTVKLGDVRQSNIGTAEGGVDYAELTSQLLDPVLDSAMDAAKRAIVEATKDDLKKDLEEKAKDKLKGILGG